MIDSMLRTTLAAVLACGPLADPDLTAQQTPPGPEAARPTPPAGDAAAEADRRELIAPGEPVDYAPLAFYPKRWREQEIEPRMVPWHGEHTVFLTRRADLDRTVMTRLVDRLDGGWQVYHELTGRTPRPFKMLGGLPVIAAVPKPALTCGLGCGYVGATGIELAGFERRDYERMRARPAVMPHYYFYEQGRNFYTFGDRHSLFVTGFAVFMRYVCMDALGCEDLGPQTRRTIQRCEAVFAAGDLPFLDTFTNLGAGEKSHRLRDADGEVLRPSDQPCMYASAMLALRREHGGDAWVGRFFRRLATVEPVKPENLDAAWRQCVAWLCCASAAAAEDLSPTFCDRWRLPLTTAGRDALAAADWTADDFDLRGLIDSVASAGR